MPSLRQILAAHAPLLLLDATSSRVQVGFFGTPDPGQGRWASSEEEAGVGLFRCIEDLEADLAAVRSFAFAEGPGSVLGIRTAATALRSWCAIASRPVYAYHALAVLAEALPRPEGTAFIADARRGGWHLCRRAGPVRRVSSAELEPPLAAPEGFRSWAEMPPGVERVPYVLSELLVLCPDAELFRKSPAPDALLHEEPHYVTWSPQIHRAP